MPFKDNLNSDRLFLLLTFDGKWFHAKTTRKLKELSGREDLA